MKSLFSNDSITESARPDQYSLDTDFSEHDPRFRVEYYSNEKSIKEKLRYYFIQNKTTSFRLNLLYFLNKLATCILYVVRVQLDHDFSAKTYKLPSNNLIKISPQCWNFSEVSSKNCINWDAIVYIERHQAIYILQVILAVLSCWQILIMSLLTYKGNAKQTFFRLRFIFESVIFLICFVSIFWPPLRYIYTPIFLNCWLAKSYIQNDLHRSMHKSNSALYQKSIMLVFTFWCLAFTGACAMQHIQRGSVNHLNLFQSFWFIVVTFSTVGYGDIHPDIWPSQLFMIILIVISILILPSKFEELASVYVERKKSTSTSYSRQRVVREKHVVVCMNNCQNSSIMEFLNEFYAHRMLQNYCVVFLCPIELDKRLSAVFQSPMWSQRVVYIQGSALNNFDLNRAQIQFAEACFIMADRNYPNREAADQHTILRSWAIKDYAPNCVQYIHLMRPENKMHVQHSRFVVCEDEFKYALLASNCICPGVSTFVTLLTHTTRGLEGKNSKEEWQILYGKSSGHEIYNIKLEKSKIFSEYAGKSFTYASFHAHRKTGIALIAIQAENEAHIRLNPGSKYIMKPSDMCFYLSETKEENLTVLSNKVEPSPAFSWNEFFMNNITIFRKFPFLTSSLEKNVDSDEMEGLNKANSLGQIEDAKEGDKVSNVDNADTRSIPEDLIEANSLPAISRKKSKIDRHSVSDRIKLSNLDEDIYYDGKVPFPPYLHCSTSICHLLRKKADLCCLKFNRECLHTKSSQVSEYQFRRKPIVLAAEKASASMYNFIVPLRSKTISIDKMYPILLVLEQEPGDTFLELIRHFPLIYWMQGSISNLEDLIRAGIMDAEYLIIVKRENLDHDQEKAFKDSNTILAVQYIFRLFPKTKICCEVVDSSNMRFMQFRSNDHFSQQISRREKIEAEKGSQIPYLFRLPFSGGNVFSATMLDALLYQSFVKNYLISFVRLMLGIDQAPGSGHLSSRKITTSEAWIKTYGQLYQYLGSILNEIPVGIYRTDPIPLNNIDRDYYRTISEIESLLQQRMKFLGINSHHFVKEKKEHSYIIINPAYDLDLKTGDIMYLIKSQIV